MTISICIVGDSGAGKTSLITRLCDDFYNAGLNATIGVECRLLRIDDFDRLKIWDLSGAPRFQRILDVYYRNVDCALVAFDSSSASGADTLEWWVDNVREQSPHARIILVATKADCDTRCVVPQSLDDLNLIQTSAKMMSSEELRHLLVVHMDDLRHSSVGTLDLEDGSNRDSIHWSCCDTQ